MYKLLKRCSWIISFCVDNLSFSNIILIFGSEPENSNFLIHIKYITIFYCQNFMILSRSKEMNKLMIQFELVKS